MTLNEAQTVHYLSTDILLLHLIASHSSYDGQRFGSFPETVAADAETVATGRRHLKNSLFSHICSPELKIRTISDPS